LKRSSLRGRVAVFLSAILLALTLSVSVLPAPAFAASSVVINPTQGAVGTQVTGTGNSWIAGHTVNVTP